MLIRDVQAQDLPQIKAIWNPVIRDTVATFNSIEKTQSDLLEMLANKQTNDHAFVAAVEENVILGFALYGQFRGGYGYRHTMEHTIVLSDAAQGKGVGRALMTALESHAKARDVHSLFAGVSAENTGGVLFHKACGYTQVATLQQVGRKFDRWFDLVLLQKVL